MGDAVSGPGEPEFITGTKSDTNGSLFGRTIRGVI
jgi:hypothetical protein